MPDDHEPIRILSIFNIPLVMAALYIGGVIVGFVNAGILGVMTSVVSLFLCSVGLRTVETGMPGMALWVHRAMRWCGVVGVGLTLIGAVIGGWRWGWIGAIVGYFLAQIISRGLFLSLERRARNSPKYQEMIDSLEGSLERARANRERDRAAGVEP